MRVQPDPQYNPDSQLPISSETRLGRGITMAKFLGSRGSRTSFRHIIFDDARRQIARNLTLHARAMDMINGNTDRFNDVRIIVSEGIYNRKPIDSGVEIMEQKAIGNLIYFQVIGTDGQIDLERTFDVAEYWKDHMFYKTLFLDYDTYNFDGTLTGQIGLLMPSVPASFEVRNKEFKRDIVTVFNNEVQSKDELIEILSIKTTQNI